MAGLALLGVGAGLQQIGKAIGRRKTMSPQERLAFLKRAIAELAPPNPIDVAGLDQLTAADASRTAVAQAGQFRGGPGRGRRVGANPFALTTFLGQARRTRGRGRLSARKLFGDFELRRREQALRAAGGITGAEEGGGVAGGLFEGGGEVLQFLGLKRALNV